jgi:hypothetical protein
MSVTTPKVSLTVAVQVDLHTVRHPARPAGVVVIGQQGHGDLPALLHGRQVDPPADLAALRGLDRLGELGCPVVETH